jgi:hypothetical protein
MRRFCSALGMEGGAEKAAREADFAFAVAVEL